MRSPGDQAAVLEVRNIAVQYRAAVDGSRSFLALRGISLSLQQGESLGVIGTSGSGKTTLALSCAGLLAPTSGQVLHCGRDIYHQHWQLWGGKASPVQMVFQNPLAALDPRRSIGSWLSLVYRHRRGYAAGEISGIEETLDLVRLPTRVLAALPSQLSGGECQRVCIAAGVLAGAKALVLDEPVSMLDSIAWQAVVKVLRAIRQRLAIAFLIVSHDLRFVAELCEEVIVLADGEILEMGRTQDIYRQSQQELTRRLVDLSLDPIA